MPAVEVRQIGHVAVKPEVRTIYIEGHPQTKALVTVMSNTRWTDRQGRSQERATAIAWTLWGDLAVSAGQYLNVGSKVAVAGTLKSAAILCRGRRAIFSFGFTDRAVDYLESRGDTEARSHRRANSPASEPTNRPSERAA